MLTCATIRRAILLATRDISLIAAASLHRLRRVHARRGRRLLKSPLDLPSNSGINHDHAVAPNGRIIEPFPVRCSG
jgi:hypothetical protein